MRHRWWAVMAADLVLFAVCGIAWSHSHSPLLFAAGVVAAGAAGAAGALATRPLP